MTVAQAKTLPFNIVNPGSPLKRYTAFIYGFAGVGKTYLIRSMIETPMAPVLVCSCDEGHLTLRDVIGQQIVVTQTSKMADFNPIFAYLLEGRHPFKSVVIDNVSELHRNALLTRAEANSVGKARDYYSLTQQDYGEARNQMLGLVSDFSLELKNLNVIFTALANRVQGQDSSVVEVSLSGKVGYEVPAYCDVIGYLSKETHSPKLLKEYRDAGKQPPPERRILQVDSSYSVPLARNRGGYLPDKIANPNLYEIFKAIALPKDNAK